MNLHELNTLPLHELRELIAEAERMLKVRQQEARKEVIAQIHAMAEDVGITVTIRETESAKRGRANKGSKVPAKFRNPDNPTQTWSGRGVKPRWLQALLDEGRDIEEFRI